MQRHDTCIDNPQVGRTVDLQSRVHNTTLVPWQHRCGTNRVIFSDGGGLGVSLEVDVSRPVFTDNHVAVSLRETDATGVVGTSGGDFSVERNGEVLGVDDGVLCGIGRLDVDGAAREQVLVGSEDGEVGLVGLGSTRTGKVTVNTDEFHLTDLVRVVVEEVELLLQGLLVRSTACRDILGDIGDHGLGTLITNDTGERDVRDGRNSLGKDGSLVGLVSGSLLSSESGVGSKRVKSLESRLEVVYGSRVGVVLEVLADIGVLVEKLDTSFGQNMLGADTGKFEELGSVDGTTGKDDFLGRVNSVSLAVAGESNTGGREMVAAGVKVDLGDKSVGEDVKVVACLVGEEVGRGRVGTSVVGRVDIGRLLRDTDVLTSKSLVVLGDAEAAKSGDPSLNLVGNVIGESNLDGTRVTVVRGDGLDTKQVGVLLRRGMEALRLFHSRVEVVPVPSRVTELLPSVDLVSGGSVPNEEVQGGGTTEKLTTRPRASGDTVGSVGNGSVVPVVDGTEISTELSWSVDDANAETVSTSLEDTDLVLATFGKAGSKSKTGSTGTDDDVVELFLGEVGSVVGDRTSGEVGVFSHAGGHLGTRADLGPCDRSGSNGSSASQSSGGDEDG